MGGPEYNVLAEIFLSLDTGRTVCQKCGGVFYLGDPPPGFGAFDPVLPDSISQSPELFLCVECIRKERREAKVKSEAAAARARLRKAAALAKLVLL